MRVVGKIIPAAANTATCNTVPQLGASRGEILVVGNTGTQITNVSGILSLTKVPQAAHQEKSDIHYTMEPTIRSYPAWVKVSYNAPKNVKPIMPGAVLKWRDGETGLSAHHTQSF